MDALELFLREARQLHDSGAAVAETSYYPALAQLINEIGSKLKPKVRCVVNPANSGAGIPDIGLFTSDQFQKAADLTPRQGQLPSRGVLEAKPPSQDIQEIAASDQVKKYCAKYGLVIVTNLREFLLVSKSENGEPFQVESFQIAADEQDFWSAGLHPSKTSREIGGRFCDFLTRVLLHAAPLYEPSDLAWFLASYARDAKDAVERSDAPALLELRAALEDVLGMKFTGQKGEHFFRSTLVQTIFYGIFSAWVIWCHSLPENRRGSFDWKQAQWLINVPFIRTLFENLMMPGKLKPLGLVEILDRTQAALNRVDRGVFFGKFRDEHAVQYFYEPFLEAFDPELRKDLGVWYTPREIVRYQVSRIDRVLKEELLLPDGLADPQVLVLDPCCGTGTYLIEVLEQVQKILSAKGEGALVAAEVKKAAMTRVFGFEILPAPFVVSHLQLGLLLQRMGAPLQNQNNERVPIFLTNALTGWEAHKESKKFAFPELEQEHAEAERVKQKEKILVILGNPPYNAFAGVSPEEELGLVEPYKVGLNVPIAKGGWGIKKFNLDDLYVRFFRLAERRIAEMSGKGIVSFISNHSWISEPSFVVLRKRLFENFDKIWIENLHGNRKISEYAPDGSTSETIFAVRGISVGIQQGVATSLWFRSGIHAGQAIVYFRDDINAAKANDRREQLVLSLQDTDFQNKFSLSRPTAANRYSFRPENVSAAYASWPKVTELCEIPPSNGLMEKRGDSLIDIDRGPLEARMKDYFDQAISWDQYKQKHEALTRQQARFEPIKTREKALQKECYNADQLMKYAVRPFDTRWCYYTSVRPIWNEPRPTLYEQCFVGNSFILTRMKASKTPEGAPFYYCKSLSDDHLISPDASCFPFRIAPKGSKADRAAKQVNAIQLGLKANLSVQARSYLTNLGASNLDEDITQASLLWYHALAIGYCQRYLTENADGIRVDWPRIPLPKNLKNLEASAAVGLEVARLLDVEAQVPGVTAGELKKIFRSIAVVRKEGGGQIDPLGSDLEVTAGWGHAGKEGVTMPAKGKLVRRKFAPEEIAEIEEHAKETGTDAKKIRQLLGSETTDVYLNDRVFWSNVPAAIWNFHIGGYQVIKKWLSYRERNLLRRSMRLEEATEVTTTARRLATLVLMQPALNENYLLIRKNTFSWPRQ